MRQRLFMIVLCVLTALGSVCGTAQAEPLVIYCGRSKSLVEPLIEQFEKRTGIEVAVRYGKTSALALALQAEGSKTKADVFWAQDVAALGAMAKSKLAAPLPNGLFTDIPAWAQPSSKRWIATSGRTRILAYAPSRVSKSDLPGSVFDLTKPKWKGKVGWAPTNGSFQAFVTAMREAHGDAKTKAWLAGMKANGAKVYPKNTPIVQALADGEIDLGIPNHYYLLRFKAKDPKFPVAQQFFKSGDIGNLVMVSGVCVTTTSENKVAAHRFIEFLLSEPAQKYFTLGVNEYPATQGVAANPKLSSDAELNKAAPKVELDSLQDLEGTLKLLREVGLI